MSNSRPLISVITACRNSARHLEEAIASVQAQTYRHFEHIVIDGGSTDGTLDLIRRHAGKLAYWVSEPDQGIGDAWNKGLAAAKGQIIGLLNSDDVYEEHAFETVVGNLRPSDRALTYGTAKLFREDVRHPVEIHEGCFVPGQVHCSFGFMHTTCFVPAGVYAEIGRFSTRYRIAVDTDFLLRCFLKGVEFRKLGNVTYMREGGLSRANPTSGYLEYVQQLYRHGFPKRKIARALLWHFRRRLAEARQRRFSASR